MPTTPDADIPQAAYDTYDAFLRQAMKDYYEHAWKGTHRTNFVALLIASGQTMALAKDSLTGSEGVKRAAIGAGAVVALRLGLRWALGGPLGILLTGLTAASLVAFFFKNQKEIANKIGRFRTLITDTRAKFDEIQTGYRAGRYDARERNLMAEGLQKRFLADADEV